MIYRCKYGVVNGVDGEVISSLCGSELVANGRHSTARFLRIEHGRAYHDIERDRLVGILAEFDTRVLDETEAGVHRDVSNMARFEITRRTAVGIQLLRKSASVPTSCF